MGATSSTASRLAIRSRRTDREPRIRRTEPADRVVPHVGRIPVGIVRLLLDLDGVPEPDPLEGGVPQQRAVPNDIPVLGRYGVLEPEHDRLLRF
jgi:hypothetical protein